MCDGPGYEVGNSDRRGTGVWGTREPRSPNVLAELEEEVGVDDEAAEVDAVRATMGREGRMVDDARSVSFENGLRRADIVSYRVWVDAGIGVMGLQTRRG